MIQSHYFRVRNTVATVTAVNSSSSSLVSFFAVSNARQTIRNGRPLQHSFLSWRMKDSTVHMPPAGNPTKLSLPLARSKLATNKKFLALKAWSVFSVAINVLSVLGMVFGQLCVLKSTIPAIFTGIVGLGGAVVFAHCLFAVNPSTPFPPHALGFPRARGLRLLQLVDQVTYPLTLTKLPCAVQARVRSCQGDTQNGPQRCEPHCACAV